MTEMFGGLEPMRAKAPGYTRPWWYHSAPQDTTIVCYIDCMAISVSGKTDYKPFPKTWVFSW